MQFIENRTYDELRAGDSVTLARHLRAHDVQALATPALAHRILLSPAAQLARRDVDEVVRAAVLSVPVPDRD